MQFKSNHKKKQKPGDLQEIPHHNEESALLNFGINESEISIIESLNPSFIAPKMKGTKNFLNHTEAFEDLQTKEEFTKLKLKSDKSSYSKKSKGRKGNITISRDFEEDSVYAQRRMTKPRKPPKSQKGSHLNRDQTQNLLINNYRNYSDESDVVHEDESLLRFNNLSNAYDDSYNYGVHNNNVKTTYLNIMTIGASNLGKFNFIEFFFEKCFNKKIQVDTEYKKIREFVHEINSRKLKRVMTIIHTMGYHNKYALRDWYENIKNYITDKMDTFDEIRKLWHKDKKLQRQAVMDCRVHLCLYFLESPTISENEMVYIRKLSKYVNIMPILVETRTSKFLDLEGIKLNVKHELHNNDVSWFDLNEDDIAFCNFRNNLLGKTTPFLIIAPEGKIDIDSDNSDILVLFKMLITPYINTFYYKTEILWNLNIEEIREKKVLEEKKRVENNQGNRDTNFSFGLALGLGFLGAVVAVKNKLL